MKTFPKHILQFLLGAAVGAAPLAFAADYARLAEMTGSSLVPTTNKIEAINARIEEVAGAVVSGLPVPFEVPGTANFGRTHENAVSGESAFVSGGVVSASGKQAHAEGWATEASGDRSHTEGQATRALAHDSHAEGFGTVADASYDFSAGVHAEGYETRAAGYGAHAEGRGTEAVGQGAHAEGFYSGATDKGAHGGGHCAFADGYAAFAHGVMVVAGSEKTVALGEYARAADSGAFVWNGIRPESVVWPENQSPAEARTILWAEDADVYASHGPGTFNLNPAGGADGVFIGDESLRELVERLVEERLAAREE